MGSVLRSVGASQGNIWSVAPFIPVGPSKNGLKKHEKSDFSKNARPIFLVFSHNPSILGMKEIPKFSRSVTYTLGWIWSGRGVTSSHTWGGEPWHAPWSWRRVQRWRRRGSWQSPLRSSPPPPLPCLALSLWVKTWIKSRNQKTAVILVLVLKDGMSY